MKKTIAAVTAGLTLVASQALAAQSGATVARVSDRVGASAGESSEMMGAPLAGVLLAAAAIAFVIYGVNEDDSDSD